MRILILPFITLFLVMATSFPIMSQPCPDGASVTPVLLEGNPPSCNGFDSGFRIEMEPIVSGTYHSDDGLVEVTITVNGQYFSWSSNYPIDAVTVKGGPNANQFHYGSPTYSDNCLSAPLNANIDYEEPYDLGYIDFCYSEQSIIINCPPDVTVECGDPTSFSFTGEATASTNCSLSDFVGISSDDQIISGADCPDNITILRTWTAVDFCGNSISCTQWITVVNCCIESSAVLSQDHAQTLQFRKDLEYSPLDFTLSPNPANQFVQIKLNMPIEEGLFIEMFNVQGQRVLQQRIKDKQSSIDLNTMRSGVYLVHLVSASGHRITKKILITN